MVTRVKDNAIPAVMSMARVRMKMIVKMRDEIMSRALKDLFQKHLYPEIKGDVIPPIISAQRERGSKNK